MISDLKRKIVQTFEAEMASRPLAADFETAYQVRVAIDRIKFAIEHTEQFGLHSDPIREVGLQLLDALDRLEAVDRRFQNQVRASSSPKSPTSPSSKEMHLDSRRDGDGGNCKHAGES
jgi:hypothetical protein